MMDPDKRGWMLSNFLERRLDLRLIAYENDLIHFSGWNADNPSHHFQGGGIPPHGIHRDANRHCSLASFFIGLCLSGFENRNTFVCSTLGAHAVSLCGPATMRAFGCNDRFQPPRRMMSIRTGSRMPLLWNWHKNLLLF